eukprot:COSAG04_NODE_29834_length_266_cov_0.784431_1_plen_54_part_10
MLMEHWTTIRDTQRRLTISWLRCGWLRQTLTDVALICSQVGADAEAAAAMHELH